MNRADVNAIQKALGPGETLDTLFGGRLLLVQHKDGYRFSLDAILLARFAAVQPGDRVVDLGTGCGIIAVILGLDARIDGIVGVEAQSGLAGLARKNACLNGLADRILVCESRVTQVSEHLPPGAFDLAVLNPPYGRPASGRVNPRMEKAQARHEILGTLGDFVQAAAYLLRFAGRLDLIYRPSNLPYLFRCLQEEGFAPKRLRMVHGKEDSPARLVLVSASKGGGEGLAVDPPLILYHGDGAYTKEFEEIYRL